MEAEIDLGKYFAGVARRWRWLLVAALVAGVTAFITLSAMPKSYEATANVLLTIRQTGSQLGTNEPLLAIETIDVGARRQGLGALASSTAIESQIAPEVLQRSGPDDYKPGMLIENELIDVAVYGDLVAITATAASPRQAKELADAWATTFVATVGRLYTDGHSSAQLTGSALEPIVPAAPKVLQSTVLAALAGLMLGVLAAIIATYRGTPEPAPQPARTERGSAQPQPLR